MEQDQKIEIIKDFRPYLEKIATLKSKSRSNDVSWIKSLMQRHNIFSIETMEDVEQILKYESLLMQQPDRKVYKTKRDLTNFRHALKLFLAYMKCRREAERAMQRTRSFDDMIEQIAQQACLAHATTMYEATLFAAFQKDYIFTSDQKTRIMANLAKFDSRFSVEKFFAPGSNYYSK